MSGILYHRYVNIYIILIISFLFFDHLLDTAARLFDISRMNHELPEEFRETFTSEKYKTSLAYTREKSLFCIFENSLFLAAAAVLIITGGFNLPDKLARSLELSPVPAGLVFAALLFLASEILQLPLSAYGTFGIEARYGFNRTSVKLFFMDKIKTWLLSALIGGILLYFLFYLFNDMGRTAWFAVWILTCVFQLFLVYLAPSLILPLFNAFSPLGDGELKKAVSAYALSQSFEAEGIFVMDGSKRSSKSNAFFTGFGRKKRIVFFDTLMEKHTIGEIISILAHEMGHYRKKHILRSLSFSFFSNGVLLSLVPFFIDNPLLFSSLGMEDRSIHAGLLFASFLLIPPRRVFAVLGNLLSRRHEREADRYAAKTAGKPADMIEALKKLSRDNFINLRPHPLKVFLHDSHPPVLERIEALKTVLRET
ncbi:MAG TPA: M48 family metallopeptidase [bacterium]|nr:M48 family metallopeptidase [bacterium]